MQPLTTITFSSILFDSISWMGVLTIGVVWDSSPEIGYEGVVPLVGSIGRHGI